MSERRYIDFKLYLTKPDDDEAACEVTLLPTPEVGESMRPVSVTIPETDPPFSDLRDSLSDKSISIRNLIKLGKILADCLLPTEGQIRSLFRDAWRQAGISDGVRLRLIIADKALRQWPWEYIYLDLIEGSAAEDNMRGFLILDPRISIVRHEALPLPHATVPEAETDITDLRMLVATALPKGEQELDLQREVEKITKAVKDFDVEGVRITHDPILTDVTHDELRDTLLHTKPVYIFHFAGHGIIDELKSSKTARGAMVEEGKLLLVKDKIAKETDPMSASHLASMLVNADVRLAVLSACLTASRSEYSPWDSVAGALVWHGVPAIVAMQYKVEDDPAVAFNSAFYTALSGGLSLDEAMSAGRLAMKKLVDLKDSTKSCAEWGVPVLYSRLVDGKVFPERMARAGAVAEQFRHVFTQNVKRVAKGGKVIGLSVEQIGSSVMVKQELGVVHGEATTLEVDETESGARIHAETTADVVDGTLTTAKIKKL